MPLQKKKIIGKKENIKYSQQFHRINTLKNCKQLITHSPTISPRAPTTSTTDVMIELILKFRLVVMLN